MDATSLNTYWEELELCGAVPLVAVLQGKIVGHLDLVVSREPFLGHFLWLDVLMVHREHRRKGVATALIGAAEKIARKQGIDVMMTYPQEYDGPSGLLYRSAGFQKFQERHKVDIECDKAELPDEIAIVSTRINQPPPLDTHEMICGRENTSQRKWIAGQLQAHVYHPLKSHDIMLAGLTEAGTYYFRIQQWAPRNKGRLTLLSPLEGGSAHLADIISTVKTLAIALGMNLVEGIVLEKDLETLLRVGFRDKEKTSPLMRKSLGS